MLPNIARWLLWICETDFFACINNWYCGWQSSYWAWRCRSCAVGRWLPTRPACPAATTCFCTSTSRRRRRTSTISWRALHCTRRTTDMTTTHTPHSRASSWYSTVFCSLFLTSNMTLILGYCGQMFSIRLRNSLQITNNHVCRQSTSVTSQTGKTRFQDLYLRHV